MTTRKTIEAAAPDAAVAAAVARNAALAEPIAATGRYTVSCVGPREECRDEYVALRAAWEAAVLMDDVDGATALRLRMEPMEEVKWEDEVENLVTTAGKNDLLDKYLSGSAYTAAWYLGLVDGGSTPTYAAGDTAASHAGWTESTAYSNANRPTPSFNAASAGSKATTATAFNINATATIAGVFLISNNTKGGTSGILYSCGNFTGGNRAVANGDTLNVTYTAAA